MIIFINQIRMKIGVMFGSPETTTGGNALKFYSSVRVDIRRIGAIKEREQIIGNQTFKGAQVMASDLRASISLVLAAMNANGQTTLNRVYHLDRGYENIEKTLGSLGVNIKRKKN